MNAQEELNALKQGMLKRARITSVMLGFAAVFTVLSMVYGFTQSIEAKKQKDLAIVAFSEAEKVKLQLVQCESAKSK